MIYSQDSPPYPIDNREHLECRKLSIRVYDAFALTRVRFQSNDEYYPIFSISNKANIRAIRADAWEHHESLP